MRVSEVQDTLILTSLNYKHLSHSLTYLVIEKVQLRREFS